jgi:TolB-like protein
MKNYIFNPPGHGSEQMTTKDKSPSRTAAPDPKAAPPAESIQQQIKRILTSPEFKATDTQKSFLKFVVETVLSGQSHEIKGFTVATQVFGRGEDFNQATDPIVSIQANKLRRALERYYLTAGRNDPVHIDMPKGTYVPVFHYQNGVESDSSPKDASNKFGFAGAWPTILVKPFLNLTGDEHLDYMGIGLATELSTEITRYQEIRVVLMQHREEGQQRRAEDTGARFMLDGSIQSDASGLKVNVSLVDLSTGLQIWGDSYKTDCSPSALIAFQEEVANTIAGTISCEYGIIAKTLSHESKRHPPSKLKTYEAMLQYYEFNARFTAETFFDAFEALQQASRKEPDCGLVWSMLARLYATNYSLDLFDLETPLEKAVSFAERGVQLEPANQRTRMILAFVRLIDNEIPAGLSETDRAMALNPNSLIFREHIGYLLTLFGDWHRGTALIRQAIDANPYYSSIVHHTLCLDWVRQKEYQQAFLETLNFRTPLLFWDPLLKAAALGLVGNAKEGELAVDTLLQLKPDFAKRGRALIKHYIKFDDIFDRVLEGLRKSGLGIA